ncbi:MAG: DUF5673 domain-containing protein [Erysipelotrichaceae bacterium]|nr:DUF5673 domain-containing protein [Erysipelotrichaceae bacterium]
MDIKIIVMINVILWAFVGYLRFQATKVKVKFKAMKTYGLTFLFGFLGIVMYLKNPNYIMIVNFISFASAGFILNICPSGFSDRGILMLGRLHKYKNISNYEKEVKFGEVTLKFTVKRRTYYLYLDNDQITDIDKYLQKIGGINK